MWQRSKKTDSLNPDLIYTPSSKYTYSSDETKFECYKAPVKQCSLHQKFAQHPHSVIKVIKPY